MDSLTLQAEPRAVTGKQVTALRRQGITPIHLYGKGVPSTALQASSSVLQRVVARGGRNVPVSLAIAGSTETHLAFIREIQRHPLTEAILHVDFYQVSLAELMRAQVPVYLIGEAPATRTLSGTLFPALRFIEVECLPLDLPQYVEVDVSGLIDFEQAIYVSSIKLGDAVTVLTDPSELIARVNPPRVVVEEVAAAPAEEGAEVATETAEGEPEKEA
ncbi:MAG: 50S ribosomal protein L25 [Dehalococcoidia bacterium]|nr:50S ribosomal protein L25 [Dehalococcoidia bacterium]